jgi:hypothetical protein
MAGGGRPPSGPTMSGNTSMYRGILVSWLDIRKSIDKFRDSSLISGGERHVLMLTPRRRARGRAQSGPTCIRRGVS